MKKFIMFIVAIITFVFSSYASSNPKPLGLELGVATISEAKAKYNLIYDGINKYTLGKMYKIKPSELNIEGLKEISLIFSKDEKLQGILMTFPKDFNDTFWNKLFNSLKKKYILKSSYTPFVGNKYALFEKGNSIIKLESPHLDFTIYLIYMTKNFRNLYFQKKNEEQRNKTKTLESNL